MNFIGAGQKKNLLRNPQHWKLRDELIDHAQQYANVTKDSDKNKIVEDFEKFVRGGEGRFLIEDPEEPGYWIDVADERKLKDKLMQAMRDYSTKRNKLAKQKVGGDDDSNNKPSGTEAKNDDGTADADFFVGSSDSDNNYANLMAQNRDLREINSSLSNQVRQLQEKLDRSEEMCNSLQKFVMEKLQED